MDETNDGEDIVYLFDDESDDPDRLEAAVVTVEERCKAVGLPCTVREQHGKKIGVMIDFPSAGEPFRHSYSDLEDLDDLIESKFERYGVLEGYRGVYNLEDDVVECMIRGIGNFGFMSAGAEFASRIAGHAVDLDDVKYGQVYSVIKNEEDEGRRIEIGHISADASRILGRSGRGIVMRLIGFKVSDANRAASVLNKVANAIFFQMDTQYGIGMQLLKLARPVALLGERKRGEQIKLSFPRNDFDEDPVALYWYGQSARQLPLLRFLALYQCVEYYFNIHVQGALIERARGVIKSPSFNFDLDGDVGKLLDVLFTGRGKGHMGEEDQLKAAVKDCVNAGDLRAFITGDPELIEYYSSKNKKTWLRLSATSIPISNKDEDLRGSVASRIYDIRCKIVHTKNEYSDQCELLLPHSQDAMLVRKETALVQFIARCVLVHHSRSLQGRL